MTVEGADIESLERLAKAFQTSSRILSDMRGQLDRMFSETAWHGADVDRQLAEWARLKTTLVTASTSVGAHADELRTQAAEQFRASAAAGPAGVGGVGGLLAMSATAMIATVLAGGGQVPAEIAALLDAKNPKDLYNKLKDLSPEEGRRLARKYPEYFGNRDGVPAYMRGEANLTLLNRELETATGKRRASLLQIKNAVENDHATILMFDPAGDGKAAVAYGDVSTAEDVAVTVPGINNDLNNFSGQMGDANRLKMTMDETEPGKGHAVVAWLGYDPPNSILDTNVLSDARARAAGPPLRSFVDGLRAENPREHLTVIGHSYGSLAVGETARDGRLAADEVVFIGSPGTGVSRASQLNINPGGHVWASHSTFDGVSVTPDVSAALTPGAGSYYGRAPTDGAYGANTFDTGNGFHGAYYRQNSIAIENLARITTGGRPTR